MNKPNSITGTPDGKKLFVADIGIDRTYVYDTSQSDGTLANKTLFCAKGSDGMTIDERGNIYLCGRGGVTVFDPTPASKSGTSPSGKTGLPTSFSAASRSSNRFFITASKSLYSIKLCRVKEIANPSK